MHQEAGVFGGQDLAEHATVGLGLGIGKIPVDFQHEVEHRPRSLVLAAGLLEKAGIAAGNNGQADHPGAGLAGQATEIALLLLQAAKIKHQVQVQAGQQRHIRIAEG